MHPKRKLPGMNKSVSTEKDPSPTVNDTARSEEGTTYGPYSPAKLDFDPLKDLNLPGSYDEVIKRFKGLQGERSQEVLN
jgi:hypothetical protein